MTWWGLSARVVKSVCVERCLTGFGLFMQFPVSKNKLPRIAMCIVSPST